jgi:hypothetical protein
VTTEHPNPGRHDATPPEAKDPTVQVTTFASASGGQGTTTLAAVYALHVADRARQRGNTARLVSHDPDDMAATLGLPTGPEAGSPLHVISGLVVAAHIGLDGPAVYDAGTLGPNVTRDDLPPGAVYLVLRGPSYNGLRRIVNSALWADAIVTVTEPGRALTSADVREVTGMHVIDGWEHPAATSRAIDAGLLVAKPPEQPAELTARAVVAGRVWLVESAAVPPSSSETGRRVIDDWSVAPHTAPTSNFDPPSPWPPHQPTTLRRLHGCRHVG